MTRNEDSGDGTKNTLAARAISNEPGRRRFIAEGRYSSTTPLGDSWLPVKTHSSNGPE